MIVTGSCQTQDRFSGIKELFERVFAPPFAPLPAYDSLREICGDKYDGVVSVYQRKFGEDVRSIKADDVSMIYAFCYSFEMVNSSENSSARPLFKIVHESMLSCDFETLKSISHFLWGFLHSLRSLGLVHYERLYRGTDKAIGWKKGDEYVLAGLTSTSLHEGVAMKVFNNSQQASSKTMIVFHDVGGYDISKYTLFPEEGEVILEPFSRFVVRDVEMKGDVKRIELSEHPESLFVCSDKIPLVEADKHDSNQSHDSAETAVSDHLIRMGLDSNDTTNKMVSDMALSLRVSSYDLGNTYIFGIGRGQDVELGIKYWKALGPVTENVQRHAEEFGCTNEKVGTELKLCGKIKGDDCVVAVAQAMKLNKRTVSLDLRGRTREQREGAYFAVDPVFGLKGAKSIADMLMFNTTLTKLDILNNEIGDEGMCEIAESLRHNSSITYLSISATQFGDEGAKGIARMLSDNSSISSLYMNFNRIGDDGMFELAQVLQKHSSVKVFSVSSNLFSYKGVVSIAMIISKNSHIEKLDLSYNGIGVFCATVIANALKSNSHLSEIHMEGNSMEKEGEQALQAASRPGLYIKL